MNWLAHLLLSEPEPAFRIGNLLPDILSAPELAGCPPEFQAGIQRHRQIDSFTDSHPVVRRSVRRISPPFRRFGGIITDILYDHFLAREWNLYSTAPLPAFIAEIHASFGSCKTKLSPGAFERLEAMRIGNWLGSYYEIEGLQMALNRTGGRLRQPVRLGEAIPALAPQMEVLKADFTEFFPDLYARFSGNGQVGKASL